jgi:four helix bundle protein
MEKVSVETETRAHKNLDVWKRSMKLGKLVYQITSRFPSSEQFGLVSQMRRAAVSIPCNLAEGAARLGKKEFLQFINIAQGSASELDTQAELAKELGFLDQRSYDDIQSELKVISKQLYGLAKSIKTK